VRRRPRSAPRRSQAGAQLIELRGSFDDALRICRELGQRPGFVLVNSLNPDRIAGQKRVVAELVEQLGEVPALIALPFGGGGNVSAVAAGLDDAGLDVQIVVGQAAERPTTWASAIRIAGARARRARGEPRRVRARSRS
jgi:threonine synthase